MMKKVLFGLFLLVVTITNAQTKSDLIGEIEAYKKSKLQNQTYDVSFKELFDAITIMGNQYYGSPTRESESRGYVEYFLENGDIKETLAIEIKGEKQPYKISFNYKKEKKQTSFKTEGTFGQSDYKLIPVDAGWKMEKIDISIVNTNFHLRIYKILFGEFNLPDDLKIKIEKFNSTQKRDKKKIIQGTDFEL
jgi:hypothetical protein